MPGDEGGQPTILGNPTVPVDTMAPSHCPRKDSAPRTMSIEDSERSFKPDSILAHEFPEPGENTGDF